MKITMITRNVQLVSFLSVILLSFVAWWMPISVQAKLCLQPLCGTDVYSGATKSSTTLSLSMTGLGSVEPVVAAAQIINLFLSILGFLTLTLTIYGGWIWIWARGNEEEITKGKEIIKGSIYGMLVVLSSFGILQWIFYYFTKITNAVM